MKKRCVFSHRRLFFSAWRPSRNTIFYNTKATFSFSVFLRFFQKNVQKRAPKSRPRFSLKNHPKVVPGDPFWDPKRSRINVGEVKKPKNVTKKSILETVGFRSFFKLKKALATRSSTIDPSRKLNSKSIEPSRDLISSALSIYLSIYLSRVHGRPNQSHEFFKIF